MKNCNLIIAGVGGQGVILAGNVIGEAAMSSGYDIKKTDTIGMAQRGGNVISHLRIAQKIYSPIIGEGEADIVMSFEKMEAARCSNFIKSDGIVILNNRAIPPLSVSRGVEHYPTDEEIISILKQKADKIYFVEGTKKAEELGNARTLNIFMLGCLSCFLDIEDSVWRECIIKSLPSRIVGVNIAAFEQGIEAIKI
ncbi:MAG: indolepyruvate oxidoreductase subunit beta [bacterium]|nr:indolepyruvate oxidoreductase subunit beta [bacterium]